MATAFRLWLLVSCGLLLAVACHGLQVGFYQKTCPKAEAIVRAEVQKAVRRDPGLGAGLLRMLFHDCFVEGCDASILLDPTQSNPRPEKKGPPNDASQRSYEVIDAAKRALEKACPGAVSCADVVAFAARDASDLLSGSRIRFSMPGGRLDGRRSQESQTGVLPPPFAGLGTLVNRFAAKDMTVEDLVVLSGAHSVGRSHCSSFVFERLTSGSDMDSTLANQLKRQCPANPGVGNDPVVAEDAVTPNVLDNQYYKNLLDRKVLFTSDATLMSSAQTAKMVSEFAKPDRTWEKKFAAAMVKLASIGVKTARDGEIRRNCRVVN
ncbi:hypothetical protein SETIT_8G106600v2 [Setaria italica]|uniref:Peroxidase n=1 Tax=Setaria italica TaxID=4555 RepID=K3ZMA1_SETIT|nr:peroxidase 2 [Setaria italica]RCV37995.1 hypothetical protein SETIT_8G106600v2 [Setaria italica]